MVPSGPLFHPLSSLLMPSTARARSSRHGSFRSSRELLPAVRLSLALRAEDVSNPMCMAMRVQFMRC